MSANLPKCKYWDSCYRKNAAHLAQFRHPTDKDGSASAKTSGTVASVKKTTVIASVSRTSPVRKPSKRPRADDEDEEVSADGSGGSDGGEVVVQVKKQKKVEAVLAEREGSDTEEDEREHGKSNGKMNGLNGVKQNWTVTGKVDKDKNEEDEDEEAADGGDAMVVDEEDDSLACINGVKPKRLLKDGENLEVESSSSSSKHKIKRTGDHYYCTCPAWRNQGGSPVNARTCKHLKEVLGEAYEVARCKAKNPYGAVPSSSSSKAKRKSKSADDNEDDEDDASASAQPVKKAKAPPKLLLANKWDIESGFDPKGWWISEKLDGVRAMWDPAAKAFVSRLGNYFTAPDWFIKGQLTQYMPTSTELPTTMSLDGELFCGRGMFSSTVSIVKTINSPNWAKVKYHIFDAPSLTDPFEVRLQKIRGYFDEKKDQTAVQKVVEFVKNTVCEDRAHLMEMLEEVEELGGEGLMLRKPGSLYEGKRGNTLYKVKKFYDAEAEIIGYVPGAGKHKGATGALKCKMESGKTFAVGTGMSDAERKRPPKIGSIITYRFQELTNDGVPRFPSYIGVRIDASGPSDYKFKKRS
ncbi:hypothetical protein HK104_005894 [Borealophlyctis nickersoniae]|nr:hypothetical protein HK104_005894 [Borealophlyctis nickersoniae]